MCFLYRLYEVPIFRTQTILYLDPIVGAVFVERIFRVCQFAIGALKALGNEMFRLTSQTRGGLLLMMVLFYNAYVLGAALWVETRQDVSTLGYCDTRGSCMFTLLRLVFFDGNGLDFLYSLTIKHKLLFVIVMIYLCVSAFGIINGLVGIFGTAFTRASEMAFHDMGEIHHQLARQNAQAQKDAEDAAAAAANGGGSGGGGSGGSSPHGGSPGGSPRRSGGGIGGIATFGSYSDSDDPSATGGIAGNGSEGESEVDDPNGTGDIEKGVTRAKSNKSKGKGKKTGGASPLPKKQRSFLDPLGVLGGGAGGGSIASSVNNNQHHPVIPPRRILNYEHAQLIKNPNDRRLTSDSLNNRRTSGGLERKRSYDDIFGAMNGSINGGGTRGNRRETMDSFYDSVAGGGSGGMFLNPSFEQPHLGNQNAGLRRSSSLLASDPLLEHQFHQLRNDVTRLLQLQSALTDEISVLRNVAGSYTNGNATGNTSGQGGNVNNTQNKNGKSKSGTGGGSNNALNSTLTGSNSTLYRPTSSSLKKRTSQQGLNNSGPLKGMHKTSTRRISIGKSISNSHSNNRK